MKSCRLGSLSTSGETLTVCAIPNDPPILFLIAYPASSEGSNLFELMYKNATRWTFAFQCFTNLTRKTLHDYVNDCESNAAVRIVERSLFSAQFCFVENSYAM